MAQNALELYKRIKNDPELQSQTYSLDDAGNLYDASGNRMGGQPQPQEQGFNRANFLPLVEYPDGRIEFGLPNILAAPLEGLKNFGRYGYDSPEAISDNARSAFDVAGSMATGSLAATPLKPSNALAAMGGGMAKDLPMDLASRMARAKEMGFDTDKVWYHGTNKDFKAFNPRFDKRGIGVSVAETPTNAAGYGDRIMPLMIKSEKLYDPVEDKEILKQAVLDYHKTNLEKSRADPYNPENAHNFYPYPLKTVLNGIENGDAAYLEFPEISNILKSLGYEGHVGIEGPFQQAKVFDPRNIRSVNAAFDPAKSDSANLMAVNPYTGAIVPFAVNALEDK